MDTQHRELTTAEHGRAMEMLDHFAECVGAVPEELMALLSTLLERRDDSAALVMDLLSTCCGVSDAA